MSSSSENPPRDVSNDFRDQVGDVDIDSTVVVSTGEGARFHRPPRFRQLGFETECKVRFTRPAREIPLSKAVEQGYTPCDIGCCFGDS